MNTKFFEPSIVYNSHELIGVLTATFSTIDFALLESDMFFILMYSQKLFRKVQLIRRIFQKFAIDNIKKTD